MIQYFHHINRFVGYQYPTYACFQTACTGGLNIRPYLPIGNVTSTAHAQTTQSRLYFTDSAIQTTGGYAIRPYKHSITHAGRILESDINTLSP
ncbi:hypothetical protein [Neisseria montereyensis]|uniref:Uncharacterized protein n=1 Tax=Neisseria montereyensis TaxID=2973938 RepID=A0ABT2F9T8_9NEIS|nr:hypothetical protein [Neisseria montereyensis]MCS4532932.1 hypothetical protein [Neisseria montereyensis]